MLKFPKDLDTSPKYGNQYVSFYIVDSEVTEIPGNDNLAVKNTRGQKIRSLGFYEGGSITSNNKKTIGSIYLPIPIKISTNYGVEYTDFQVTTEAFKVGIGLGSKLFGQLDLALSKINSKASIVSGILGTAASVLSDSATLGAQLIGKNQGLALNPHKELLFKGVNLRTFDFVWKLIARSETESTEILKITNEFRKAMHPKLDSGSFLYKYPSEFDIEFWKSVNEIDFSSEKEIDVESNKFLTFIAPCVLENCTLNYSGGGEYVTFSKTGAPVELELTLKFKETVVITKDILKEVGEAL
jgi:hypothetical protein